MQSFITNIDLPVDAVGVPFRGLPRFLAPKAAAAGGVIWWWLSAEETFSTILKLASDPVPPGGPEGVCITFISATIPELLLSLPIQKEDQFFIYAVSAVSAMQTNLCPLDIATLDIATALPVATSNPVTNLRQYINSDLGYNDLKF